MPDWQTIFGLKVHEVNCHTLITKLGKCFTSGPNAVDIGMPYFSFPWFYSFWLECRRYNSNEATVDVLQKPEEKATFFNSLD